MTKNYCEEKGISTSELNEAQKTLYYIAENMKMNRSISEEGYKHFQSAIKALEKKPCDDAISRQTIEKMLKAEMPERGIWEIEGDREKETVCEVCIDLMQKLSGLPSVTPQPKMGKWIPCSERLPEDLEPVNITWVNHNPVRYYADIKDKPFTATGHYCNGRWWWYSAVCQDYLSEFGRSGDDEMDDDIEVIAWMPLPAPWRAENQVEEEQ